MKITYASIIPLLGGMTISNKQVVGHNPEFIVSWGPFGKNDSHIVNYLNEVPYHVLPESGEDNITSDLRERYFEKIDFVSTVCPCAGLSMLYNASGSSSSRGSDAAQNDWMYKSAEWVLENISP